MKPNLIKSFFCIALISLTLCSCAEDDSSGWGSTTDSQGVISEAEEAKPSTDIELDDETFISTIQQIYNNFSEYEGKTISIKGISFDTGGNHFVGRHTDHGMVNPYDSMIYLEYKLPDGSEYPKQQKDKREEVWIEVRGVLKKQKEENREFYFIEAEKWYPAEEGIAKLG